MDERGGRRVVMTAEAPRPVGPYSQAVVAGGLVFTSGQIAIDPATGMLVTGEVEHEAEQVFRNLAAVLRAAGTGMENVVKVTLYLTDMEKFERVNAVYARFFREPFPARTTIQVGALPKGAAVEAEVIAVL